MSHLDQLAILFQIFLIDISLAADNAIAIGVAVAGLPAAQRHRAVWAGLGAAALLRFLLAIFAIQLLRITGLIVAGGLLLLWVAWKMFHDIRRLHKAKQDGAENKQAPKKLLDAILQIAVADISMSLDNVLGVAGAARDHYALLAFGLGFSILLMGFASALVARLLHRWHWLGYLGVATVAYVALHMIWDGVAILNHG